MKKLKAAVKNYAWGKYGITGLAGRFALAHEGFNPAANSMVVDQKIKQVAETPLAELWMGTHRSGCATV